MMSSMPTYAYQLIVKLPNALGEATAHNYQLQSQWDSNNKSWLACLRGDIDPFRAGGSTEEGWSEAACVIVRRARRPLRFD